MSERKKIPKASAYILVRGHEGKRAAEPELEPEPEPEPEPYLEPEPEPEPELLW